MLRPRQLRRARTRVSIQIYRIKSPVSSFSSLLSESGTGGGVGTGGTASSRRKDGRGTKRGRDEDDTNRRPDMKLNVPEILKVLLVDDWEAVTKNNQVRPFVDVFRAANIKCYYPLAGHPSAEPHRCRDTSRFSRIRPFAKELRVRR